MRRRPPDAGPDSVPSERRGFVIEGLVQGIGFRPFVHRTATTLGLDGFVRNEQGRVYIEVEGPPEALERFADRLLGDAPPLARIDRIESQLFANRVAESVGGAFRIAESRESSPADVCISPDIATCADCLAEIRNPADRRYRYPFINCTNCGPRLTIIRSAPYDRVNTTMAGFAMCPACRREYEDPLDRRFHAQPIACPDCGPQLRLLTAGGEAILTSDPLAAFLAVILNGGIGAMKGVGGYHLVCDAANETAVAELRRRKQRDEKPFAVMTGDVAAAEQVCLVTPSERGLLTSRQRPIVLLRRREQAELPLAASIAAGNPCLGILLPYTPLHHLLMECGRPLVMTSGNLADEPIAYQDDDAVARLGTIADVILVHDRPIHVRCDDSVIRVIGERAAPVRRSRGFAPTSLKLPVPLSRPTLAVGGQLKGTFALGNRERAFVSHHLGDLDHLPAYRSFEHDLNLYENLFAIQPELIVHDLHPDYASTGYALKRAAESGVQQLAVQHHHAHVVSCMAEHGLNGSVIGVAFDGAGFGSDGAIWGGEFLLADYASVRRAAHLRYVGLPGGEAAVREPWRMAAAHLIDAGCGLAALAEAASSSELGTVERLLARRFRTPMTSSMGRLFDAVAALSGMRTRVTYEGQAAMELEWLAGDEANAEPYPFALLASSDEPSDPLLIVDTRPLIRAVLADVEARNSRPCISQRFHATVVEIIRVVCRRLRDKSSHSRVCLSGGVFMNAWLVRETVRRLTADGFDVYCHEQVPANDGGLCLGQLAIAAAVDPVRQERN